MRKENANFSLGESLVCTEVVILFREDVLSLMDFGKVFLFKNVFEKIEHNAHKKNCF